MRSRAWSAAASHSRMQRHEEADLSRSSGRPMRPCAVPTCPNLTAGRRCQAHQLPPRTFVRDAFYSSPEWRRLSAAALSDSEGICALDGAGPRPNDPLVAAHRIPRKQGGLDELGNLVVIHRSENTSTANRRERKLRRDETGQFA